MRYRRASLVAAALGLLAGCTGSGGPDPAAGAVAVGPVATPSGPTATEMPFAAFVPGDRELAAVQRAESALLNACLAEYGLTARITAHSDAALLADLRRGTTLPRTLAEAAAHGFHNVPRPADGAAPAGRAADGPEQRDRLLVLNGPDPRPAPSGAPAAGPDREVNGRAVPRGGCAGRTERTLAKGSPAERAEHPGNSALNTLLRLRSAAWAEGAKDPAYVAMTGAWSACMREAGFSYASFDAAAEDPAWTRTAKAGARERAAATTDLRCRTRVNYLGVSEAVHLAYEKRAVRDHGATLTSVKAHYDAVARNASKVSKDS
ncbi:hypothetical protein ACFYVL_23140 [Streptomyces sp. NPDC004111]|uniref:hypothetical protein n=1 Tax=Streptomyces sp. NPDC004111 TaxID=3364690 RepID=UPI0036829483